MMKKIFVMLIILLGTSLKVRGDIMILPSGYFFDDHCPREKPFSYGTSDWGKGYKPKTEKNCVGGCDTLNTMHILYGHEEDFLICENRETIDYSSRLKVCPKDYPLREYNGNCIPCKGVNLIKNKQDCDACPNFKYKDGYCYQCPIENPLFGFGECYDCKTDYVEFSEEECNACPNRKYKDGLCYKKRSIKYFWKYRSKEIEEEHEERLRNQVTL